MCLHGLLLTHKLAGPIHRFRETLRALRERRLPSKVEIRGHDYFQDLCGEVDGLVQHLRSDVHKFQESSAELARASEALLKEGDLPGGAREKLLDIANGFSRLRQLVDGYTLEGAETPSDPADDEQEAPKPVGAAS
jgi:hypothetical protein